MKKPALVLLIVLVTISLLSFGIFIFGPSLASQELESIATENTQKLMADLPDNTPLYQDAYAASLPDELLRPLNRLNAQVVKLEAQASYMLVRLDSAAARRTNKNHNFLLKEGYADRFGQELTQADQLLDQLVPRRADSLQLSSWQAEYLTGIPAVSQQYLVTYMRRLKIGERQALQQALERR
jgi:hypothetical protein